MPTIGLRIHLTLRVSDDDILAGTFPVAAVESFTENHIPTEFEYGQSPHTIDHDPANFAQVVKQVQAVQGVGNTFLNVEMPRGELSQLMV
jgi:hypothetical protein